MKKSIVFLLCIFLFINVGAQTKLCFNSKGTFKIAQFTDLHWKPGCSDKTNEVIVRMNEVLDAEKPDLVILTGDVVYASPAKAALDSVLIPIIKRNIPFAVTFGNHDSEQGMSNRELLDYLKTKKNNLTTTADGVTGESNCSLPVYSSVNSNKPEAILYLFDSHSYTPIEGLGKYDWIKRDQINWYCDLSDKYTQGNGGKPVTSLVFFHIPLPEYKDAVMAPNSLFVGTRKEEVCCPAVNSGLYSAMIEKGDVLGCFVGHDHVNDYAVDWHGIMLAYGRFSGGSTVYNDIPGGNGARIIELKKGKREIHTWIRIKGNKIINDFNYPLDTKPSKN